MVPPSEPTPVHFTPSEPTRTGFVYSEVSTGEPSPGAPAPTHLTASNPAVQRLAQSSAPPLDRLPTPATHSAAVIPLRVGPPLTASAEPWSVQRELRPTSVSDPPTGRVAVGWPEGISGGDIVRESIVGEVAAPHTAGAEPAQGEAGHPELPVANAPVSRGFAAMFGQTAVQRATAAPTTAPPEPTPAADSVAATPSVQTAPATDAPADAAAPPSAPTAPAAPGAPAAPAALPTGAALDELARRLYEPLSARLRAELWLDRERAGLVSDSRP